MAAPNPHPEFSEPREEPAPRAARRTATRTTTRQGIAKKAASTLLLVASVGVELVTGRRYRGGAGGRALRGVRLPRTPQIVQVIEPRRPGPFERLREAWAYRSLLRFFARRFIEKMYVRTWLGKLWIPLRPVLSVGARVLIFGGLLGVPSEGTPYLLFFLVGIAAWELFSQTAYWATRSIELSRAVLKRIYVPRLTVLLASVAPSGLTFLVYLGMLTISVIGFWIADGVLYVELGPQTPIALAGLGLMVLLALGIGFWTSVYGAQARDVRFSLVYLTSFWFFLTPVIYPLSAVPETYRSLVAFNPMTAPVEMVKLGLLGTGTITVLAVAVCLSVVVGLCVSGFWFFSRSEALAVDSL
jgi:lipopolysaccharide transport system permease protein